MEVNQSAQARPADERAADRRIENLRGASLGAAVMLVIQFGLGVGVNLYVTLPTAGSGGRSIGQAFSNGALLAAHAVLGLRSIDFLASLVKVHVHRYVELRRQGCDPAEARVGHRIRRMRREREGDERLVPVAIAYRQALAQVVGGTRLDQVHRRFQMRPRRQQYDGQVGPPRAPPTLLGFAKSEFSRGTQLPFGL